MAVEQTGLIQKLNEFYLWLSTASQSNLVTFHKGEFTNKLVERCSETTPYAKILVLLSEKDNQEKNFELVRKLKSAGLRPISLILDENLTNVAVLVRSLPEDLRLILTPTLKLIDTAINLAVELGTKIVVGIDSLENTIITTKVLSVETQFVFDETLKINGASEYSVCAGKIISLLDIRLNGYLGVFSINSDIVEKLSELLHKLFKINLKTESSLEELFALRLFMEGLEGAQGYYSSGFTHDSAVKLLERVNGEYSRSLFIKPIYIELKKTNEKNYLQLLKENSRIIKAVNDKRQKLDLILGGIKAQAKWFLEHKKIINQTFLSLGGKTKKQGKGGLVQVSICKHGQISLEFFLQFALGL